MPDENQVEAKLRDRVAELERVVKALALGMKRVAQEIDSEWGEETMPVGEYYGQRIEY